jgi:histidinol-phosphatase (PHP family)
MVWFSYHGGHSGEFCGHAKDTLRAVVERAIEVGFSTYGLSEHCPRVRKQDMYPEESALTPSDLQRLFSEYVVEARKLQQEYADRIELLVGFETEALPEDSWPQLMAQVKAQHDFDFFIGSVHSVAGTFIDFKQEATEALAEGMGGWDALCTAYFDEVANLVSTLQPPVVGHIDLIRRFRGENVQFGKDVWPSISRALEAVKETGALLELNATPVRRQFGPLYPSLEILNAAHKMNIPLTLSDDSHGVASVHGGLDACVSTAALVGYRELYYLTKTPAVPSEPTRHNAAVHKCKVSLSEVVPKPRRKP